MKVYVLLECSGNPYGPGLVRGVYSSRDGAAFVRDQRVAESVGRPGPVLRPGDFEIEWFDLDDAEQGSKPIEDMTQVMRAAQGHYGGPGVDPFGRP